MILIGGVNRGARERRPPASVLLSKFSDPTKMVAYNFFKRVRPGLHTIELMVAAGSGIDLLNPPSVGSPVITLEYR